MGANGGPFLPQAAVNETATITPRSEAELFETAKETKVTKIQQILLRVPAAFVRFALFAVRAFRLLATVVFSLLVHRVLDR